MKKRVNDPISIIVGGIESAFLWLTVFAVVAVLGLAGTVTFAMLYWLG